MNRYLLVLFFVLTPIISIAATAAQFSDETEFANDIDSDNCSKLNINKVNKGWFFKINLSENTDWVGLYECKMYDQKKGYAFDLKPGMVHGDLNRKQLFILNSKSGDFIKVDAPGWSMLANPSFCKDLMAYWQMEKVKNSDQKTINGVIFDLKKAKIISSLNLGQDSTGTDNPNYFGNLKWDESCTSVDGKPPQPQLKPLNLRLK